MAVYNWASVTVLPAQMVKLPLVPAFGAATMVKFPTDDPLPTGVVTVTSPVAGPAGRTAVIVVVLVTTKLATAPSTVTAVVPEKLVPRMTRVEPPQPCVITLLPSLVNCEIVGGS